MRVLLLSMPDNIPLFNCYHGFVHNLALRSLAGNLDVKGVDVKILDLIYFRKELKKIIKKALREYRPGVVGITAMTFQYGTARKIARFIKKCDEDIKIVIGGYHATLMYEEISQDPESPAIDFIVRGEGERTFRELTENFMLPKPQYRAIDGLSFREGSNFVHNKPRALSDLSQLRLPRRSDADLFKVKYGAFDKPEVIETSRGCTYGCNFCSIRHMYGATYRKFKVERVIQDIRNARDSGAIRVIFADDNITLDAENLKLLCDAIIDSGLNDICYGTQAHVQAIARDEKLVEKLSRANFNVIFMGIENPIGRNMRQLNKPASAEKARVAVANLHKHDMAAMGGFITANPDDTKHDLDGVFSFSKEIGCDVLMTQILTPYPKTTIREILNGLEMTTNHTDYSKYNGFRCNVRTRYLTPRQITWRVSTRSIKWYLGTIFDSRNWFNKSKRVLPQVRSRIKLMTMNMIWQFSIGRYGKSSHRF